MRILEILFILGTLLVLVYAILKSEEADERNEELDKREAELNKREAGIGGIE